MKLPSIKVCILSKNIRFTYNTANTPQPIPSLQLPFSLAKLISVHINAGVDGRSDTTVRYVRASINVVDSYIECGAIGSATGYCTVFGTYA